MTLPPYRQGVVVVVVNSDGLLLACERSDRSGAWQLPQGGIEPGEAPQETMLRELLEEIGTNDVEVIGEVIEPISYDYPEAMRSRGYRGQEHRYFLVRLKDGIEPDFANAHAKEFLQGRWMTSAEFLPLVHEVKVEAYRKAILQLIELYPSHLR
jgi:putative (di)nucleoside polyphosphate hydrolase